MAEKKVIRNPSMAEIEANKRKSRVVAKETPKEEIIIEKDVTELPQQSVGYPKLMKPIGVFEPKPLPFTLPSNNFAVALNYPDDWEDRISDGVVFFRKMTIAEESIFQDAIKELNNSKKFDEVIFYNAINKIMNNCLKSDIEYTKLSVIDKLSTILFVLGQTYGSENTFDVKCPTCGKDQKLVINILKDIIIKYMDDSVEYPKTIALKSFDFPVNATLKFPDIENDIYFTVEEKQELVDQILSCVIEFSGTKPDGSSIVEADYHSIVSNLSATDKEQIKNIMNEVNIYGSETFFHNFICEDKKCPSHKNKDTKHQTIYIPIDSIFARFFMTK